MNQEEGTERCHAQNQVSNPCPGKPGTSIRICDRLSRERPARDQRRTRHVLHQPGPVSVRRFRLGVLAGAVLVLVVSLQIRFDLIGLIKDATTQECNTVLCCEECRAISVTRVIDGDTFVSASAQKVRLFGADTPERGERCFSQSTKRLRRLAGQRVKVEPGPRPQDQGGRLLFYVYTKSGESIDEKLVREGLARAGTRDGQHRDVLLDLEQAARQSGKGCLW